MAAASDYLEKKVLDHVLANTSFTSPTTVYLALFTDGGLLEAGTLNDEVSGTGYVRKEITFGAAADISGATTSKNTTDVTFPAAGSGGWGTITHVAIMDSATVGSGNVLFHGQAAAPKLIEEDDIFQVTTGNFAVTLA